jgi:hypothetical protein
MKGRFLIYEITKTQLSYVTNRELLGKKYSEILSPVKLDLLMLHLAGTSLT